MNIDERLTRNKRRSEEAYDAVVALTDEWKLRRQAVPEPTDAEWQKIKRRDNFFVFYKIQERLEGRRWFVQLDEREPVWIWRDNFKVMSDSAPFFIVKVSGFYTGKNDLRQAEQPLPPHGRLTDEERAEWRRLYLKRWDYDQACAHPRANARRSGRGASDFTLARRNA
jgi:hypothetical protein